MKAPLFPRQRAQRFAQLVDDAGGVRRHHGRAGADEEMQRLVALGRRMTDLPLAVEAHPEFRDGLRAMLMATIEREGIGATAKPEAGPAADAATTSEAARLEQRRANRRTRVFGAVVAGLAAGALALSGMSAASGDALPGDALYGVKRSTERAQLALTGSDLERGKALLDFAKTRLDEARAVRPGLFTPTLNEMDAETRKGVRLLTTSAVDQHDTSALDDIDGFVADQRPSLLRLRAGLPVDVRGRVDQSLALLGAAGDRSVRLRPLLSCGSGAVGSSDEMGPAPMGRCNGGSEQPGSAPSGPPPSGAPEQAKTEPTGSAAPSRSPAPAGGTRPSPSATQTPKGAPGPSVVPSSPPNLGGLQGNPGDVLGSVSSAHK